MGTFQVPLEIRNPANHRTETVEALVDTGATYSVAPASLLHRLGIQPDRVMTFDVASGESVEYATAWAGFSAAGCTGFARVVFGPEGQYILGATTLEDLALAVDPKRRRLIPGDNPLI